ncbi:hypothetical protein RJD24_10860 [Bacillaceae bacterium IKA-2]|nr:hypothetical protein RJD24_10860 [Bacillaceae bacterium IKA-2]
MKRFLIAIYICSLLIVTACGNEKQDSIGIVEFELIPNETDIIAIHVGGVDEDGVSTDKTNITIEEKQKIKKVLDLIGDIKVIPIEKQDVLDQELHKAIGYNLFFIEDFNSQKHSSLWLLSDGETIIIPTWEKQYYIKTDAESLYQEILDLLELQY